MIVTLPGPVPDDRLIRAQVRGSLDVTTGPAVHTQSGRLAPTDIVTLPAVVPKSTLVRFRENVHKGIVGVAAPFCWRARGDPATAWSVLVTVMFADRGEVPAFAKTSTVPCVVLVIVKRTQG